MGEALARNTISYYSHARTALLYGLQSLGLRPGDGLLLPDTICDVVLHPISRLGLEYDFYPLREDFSPDWAGLEACVTPQTRAVLMVHFFGQPQDIDRFQGFCRAKDLFLIEDNAHGHRGTLGGRELGTFGDVGISSPRKFVHTACGGLLWLRGEPAPPASDLAPYPLSLRRYFQQKFSLRYPGLIAAAKRRVGLRPGFEDPRAFRESPIESYAVDTESIQVLKAADWDAIRTARRESYAAWEGLVSRWNLVPVHPSLHPEANPWCFAAYAGNRQEATRICEWGWKAGAVVYRWPALPEEILVEAGAAVGRWDRLLCFSTASPPPAL